MGDPPRARCTGGTAASAGRWGVQQEKRADLRVASFSPWVHGVLGRGRNPSGAIDLSRRVIRSSVVLLLYAVMPGGRNRFVLERRSKSNLVTGRLLRTHLICTSSMYASPPPIHKLATVTIALCGVGSLSMYCVSSLPATVKLTAVKGIAESRCQALLAFHLERLDCKE